MSRHRPGRGIPTAANDRPCIFHLKVSNDLGREGPEFLSLADPGQVLREAPKVGPIGRDRLLAHLAFDSEGIEKPFVQISEGHIPLSRRER